MLHPSRGPAVEKSFSFLPPPFSPSVSYTTTVLGPLPRKRSARLTATVIHSHFYFMYCRRGMHCATQRTKLTDRSNAVLADQTSLPARHKLKHMKKRMKKREIIETTGALTGLLRYKTRDVSTAQAQRGIVPGTKPVSAQDPTPSTWIMLWSLEAL